MSTRPFVSPFRSSPPPGGCPVFTPGFWSPHMNRLTAKPSPALVIFSLLGWLSLTQAHGQSSYVDVTDFGAVGNGIVDDTSSIQAAINSITEGTVFFPPGDYKVSNGIGISRNNIHLKGDATATLVMTTQPANGGVLVCLRTNNGQGPYPVNLSVENVNVDLDAGLSGAGIIWKASYSQMQNVNVRIRGDNQKGVVIYGDGDTGTGSYYNQFSRVYIQGSVNSTNGYTAVGFDLVYSSSTAASRCPNANTFTNCRTGGLSTAVKLRGNDNTFVGCTHESTTQYVYDVLHESVSSGSNRNLVINPYIEQYNTAVIFYCRANASGNTLISPYYTSIAQVFTDLSTLQNNLWIDPDQ